MRADELVRAAMAVTGTDGPTALADAIGLPGRQAPRRVSRWLAGENEPDYPSTLLLLAAAGMLRENSDHGRDGDELAVRRQLTPEEEIAHQLRQQSELLETLIQVAERLDEQTALLQELQAGQRPA